MQASPLQIATFALATSCAAPESTDYTVTSTPLAFELADPERTDQWDLIQLSTRDEAFEPIIGGAREELYELGIISGDTIRILPKNQDPIDPEQTYFDTRDIIVIATNELRTQVPVVCQTNNPTPFADAEATIDEGMGFEWNANPIGDRLDTIWQTEAFSSDIPTQTVHELAVPEEFDPVQKYQYQFLLPTTLVPMSFDPENGFSFAENQEICGLQWEKGVVGEQGVGYCFTDCWLPEQPERPEW